MTEVTKKNPTLSLLFHSAKRKLAKDLKYKIKQSNFCKIYFYMYNIMNKKNNLFTVQLKHYLTVQILSAKIVLTLVGRLKKTLLALLNC